VTGRLSAKYSAALQAAAGTALGNRAVGTLTEGELVSIAADCAPRGFAPLEVDRLRGLLTASYGVVKKPNQNQAQKKLLLAAVKAGVVSADSSNAALAPLLKDLNAQPEWKQFDAALVRRKLHELGVQAKRSRLAALATAQAATLPPGASLASLVEAYSDEVIAAEALVNELIPPDLHDADLHGEEWAAREPLSEDAAAAAVEALQAAQLVHLKLDKLAAAAAALPLEQAAETDRLREELRVLAGPVSRTLTKASDLAGEAAASVQPRYFAGRKHSEPPQQGLVGQWLSKLLKRMRLGCFRAAAWAGLSVALVHIQPNELKATLFLELPNNLRATDAEMQRLNLVFEEIVKAAKARGPVAAATGGLGNVLMAEAEEEEDDERAE